MAVDSCVSQVHPSEQLPVMRTSRLIHSENRSSMDDSEVYEDRGTCFPCPFCYVDIELLLIDMHLREEHCFDLKTSVCPLCADNVSKDMIGHFRVQHTNLLKQRRYSHGSQSNSLPTTDMGELSSFLGIVPRYGWGKTQDSAPEPASSPSLSGVALPHTRDAQEPGSKIHVSPTSSGFERTSLSDEEAQEQDIQERSQRAEFCRQLLMSTIFQ
ncbi:hypothetical protein GIB67_030900 [Kingdonia uniflora]|uniref:Di19 zinc-binding domain-containing protein n=1 Tax=Kingdonia uniflora TaxID=39325 RepID=A0A7J7L3C4_9MAGN|nr:hypothetical protein GIB67_030900 [Kingdonia uniflora]